MTKLTPTQNAILTAASQRQDGGIEPLPASLKGGAQAKVMDALRRRDLIESVTDAEGLLIGHRITAAGLEAIGCLPDDADTDGADESEPDAADAPSAATGARPGARKAKGARQPRTRQKAAPAAPRAQRADSKQSRLIEMLRQPDGASISEISETFGWLPHTTRGAIAGALKKKLGLPVESQKVDGRGTVYKLPA